MRIACWIPKAKNINTENVTLIFFTATKFARTPLCFPIRKLPVLFCNRYIHKQVLIQWYQIQKFRTYLTPLCRIHLKKQTDPQLVQTFSAFYWTRQFIIAFTRASATCSYPEADQSSPFPQPTSLRFILILSFHFHLGLSSDLFFLGFLTLELLYVLLLF